MRNRRDWHDIRSTHARVLEALEQAVAAHPAGSAKSRRRTIREPLMRAVPGGRSGIDASVALDGPSTRPALRSVGGSGAGSTDSVVVPFRSRTVAVLPRTHDVEHDPDDPTAA